MGDTRHEDQDTFPTIKTLAETIPAPIIDEVTNKVTYYGWAALGVKTTEPYWKIIRVTKGSATVPQGVIITEYAGGNMKYENIWNDRTSLSYSR